MFGLQVCRRICTSTSNYGRLVTLIESEHLNRLNTKQYEKLNQTHLKRNKSQEIKVTLEPSSATTFLLPSKKDDNQVTLFRPPDAEPLTMTIDLVSLEETCNDVSKKIKTMESFVTKRETLGKIQSPINEEKPINTITDIMWRKVDHYDGKVSSFVKNVYMPLGKFRLTALVVMTAMEGYGMAPASIVFDPLVFSSLIIGTTLTSVAANSINQLLESPYDAQMNRTKNRPLASGKIS